MKMLSRTEGGLEKSVAYNKKVCKTLKIPPCIYLKVCFITFIVGIPSWRCVFNNRSYIGLVTLSLRYLLHVIRFLCKHCFLRWAQQLIIFACGSHDSFLLMITQRYFSCLTFLRFDLSSFH